MRITIDTATDSVAVIALAVEWLNDYVAANSGQPDAAPIYVEGYGHIGPHETIARELLGAAATPPPPDPAAVFAQGAVLAPYLAGQAPAFPGGPSAPALAPPVPPVPGPTHAPAMAPPVPPVPGPTNPAGVELDGDGLPWDSRIHAGTKTKTVQGVWKARKGINDPGLVKRVQAELRAAVGAPPAAPAPPPVPLPPTATPAAPPAEAMSPAAAFMARMVLLVNATPPRITQAELLGICNSEGLASLPLLFTRQDLVPQVEAAVNQLIAARP